MEECKVTREEVIGYNATDGTFFRNKADCEAYERGALCAAAGAAGALKKNAMLLDSVAPIIGCCEERIVAYEINNANDLQVLNTYLKLVNSCREVVPPKYIGQRVAIQFWIDEDDYTVLGNCEDIISALLAKLNKLFGDPEVAA